MTRLLLILSGACVSAAIVAGLIRAYLRSRPDIGLAEEAHRFGHKPFNATRYDYDKARAAMKRDRDQLKARYRSVKATPPSKADVIEMAGRKRA